MGNDYNPPPRHHDSATCPKCGAERVPVYELGMPARLMGHSMGALILAGHGCPHGGDHMTLQPAVTASW